LTQVKEWKNNKNQINKEKKWITKK
jgi:hypothetical protein